MSSKNILYFIVLLIFDTSGLVASPSDTIFIAFWNLENLFDTIDDPSINDEEFLPGSTKEWTAERFDKKIYNLARVIRSMNNNKGPDLLGVCEVENKSVLDSLTRKYLPDLKYKIIHVDSPDNRGIDNALLYKKEKFNVFKISADTVHLADGWPTRLILGITLQDIFKKRFYVFVNHWPSRSGGVEKSEPNRIEAAKTLKRAVDKIFSTDPSALIFSIGDYNDEPTNNSILNFLNAHPLKCDTLKTDYYFESNNELFNLAYEEYENGRGSFKYKDVWNLLDQIIVSGGILTGNSINYICSSFKIYRPYFLRTHSGKFKGTPFPTYGGNRYLGGYSDHFPVTAKFLIERNIQ